jgi:DNA-binding LytR/AlgR family response regulator
MDVLIIEDESLASQKLEQLLTQIDNSIAVVATVGTVRDAVTWLESKQADLIFSDIHLSDGLSFSIFEKVEVDIPVIFTTAYDQYAIDAFRVNSIDYLLKPIEIEKLTQSIKKYKSLTREWHPGKPEFESVIKAFIKQSDPYKKRFVITIGSKVKVVNTEDIAYFFSQDKNTFIQTRKNQTMGIDYSLDALEKMIDPERFFRANRKYLVHMESIEHIQILSKSKIEVALIPPVEEEVIISFKRSREFKTWLNK